MIQNNKKWSTLCLKTIFITKKDFIIKFLKKNKNKVYNTRKTIEIKLYKINDYKL